MFWILSFFFRLWVKVMAFVYGSEGINIPLMFMPTRFIGPALVSHGASIGERVRFRSPLIIHNGSDTRNKYYTNLFVGNEGYFGRELFLDLEDVVTIEDNVTISHRVMILTHTDAGSSPLSSGIITASHAPVIIRNGAYIGAGVIILQGVEIGESAAVGAGSLVRENVPPHAIVAGVPARIVRRLGSKQ